MPGLVSILLTCRQVARELPLELRQVPCQTTYARHPRLPVDEVVLRLMLALRARGGSNGEASEEFI
jgi:hypothetical protein